MKLGSFYVEILTKPITATQGVEKDRRVQVWTIFQNGCPDWVKSGQTGSKLMCFYST